MLSSEELTGLDWPCWIVLHLRVLGIKAGTFRVHVRARIGFVGLLSLLRLGLQAVALQGLLAQHWLTLFRCHEAWLSGRHGGRALPRLEPKHRSETCSEPITPPFRVTTQSSGYQINDGVRVGLRLCLFSEELCAFGWSRTVSILATTQASGFSSGSRPLGQRR